MTNTFRIQAEAFEPLIEPIKDVVEKLYPIPLGIIMDDLLKEMGGYATDIYATIYVLMSTVDISVNIVYKVKRDDKLSESLSLFLEGIKPIKETFDAILVFTKTEPLTDKEKEKLLKNIQEMKEDT